MDQPLHTTHITQTVASPDTHTKCHLYSYLCSHCYMQLGPQLGLTDAWQHAAEHRAPNGRRDFPRSKGGDTSVMLTRERPRSEAERYAQKTAASSWRWASPQAMSTGPSSSRGGWATVHRCGRRPSTGLAAAAAWERDERNTQAKPQGRSEDARALPHCCGACRRGGREVSARRTTRATAGIPAIAAGVLTLSWRHGGDGGGPVDATPHWGHFCGGYKIRRFDHITKSFVDGGRVGST